MTAAKTSGTSLVRVSPRHREHDPETVDTSRQNCFRPSVARVDPADRLRRLLTGVARPAEGRPVISDTLARGGGGSGVGGCVQAFGRGWWSPFSAAPQDGHGKGYGGVERRVRRSSRRYRPRPPPTPVPARRAIVVAGSHRSGTSALARVLSLVGCDLPKHVMPPLAGNNELGFWEPADGGSGARRLPERHRFFLGRRGSTPGRSVRIGRSAGAAPAVGAPAS